VTLLLGLLSLAAALSAADADLDKDGLSDATEQRLLEQFLPRFYLSAGECDTAPSEFIGKGGVPVATARSRTLYGQATPAPHLGPEWIELHYYHLWSKDCGRGGHPLDVEHASLLIRGQGQQEMAVYHYTAAHEGTVCDVSMARKAAPGSRAEVYISAGKHASFLSQEACNRNGCGADRCLQPIEMAVSRVVNVGEREAPLPGQEWIQSSAWPFGEKMDSDFDAALLARLESEEGPLRTTKATRGAQRTLAVGSKPVAAVETGARHTDAALQTGASETRGFLKRAAKGVGRFLGR